MTAVGTSTLLFAGNFDHSHKSCLQMAVTSGDPTARPNILWVLPVCILHVFRVISRSGCQSCAQVLRPEVLLLFCFLSRLTLVLCCLRAFVKSPPCRFQHMRTWCPGPRGPKQTCIRGGRGGRVFGEELEEGSSGGGGVGGERTPANPAGSVDASATAATATKCTSCFFHLLMLQNKNL